MISSGPGAGFGFDHVAPVFLLPFIGILCKLSNFVTF